jgi:hypothetical protein
MLNGTPLLSLATHVLYGTLVRRLQVWADENLFAPGCGKYAEIRDDEGDDEVERHLDSGRRRNVSVEEAIALVDRGQHQTDDQRDPRRAAQCRTSGTNLDRYSDARPQRLRASRQCWRGRIRRLPRRRLGHRTGPGEAPAGWMHAHAGRILAAR